MLVMNAISTNVMDARFEATAESLSVEVMEAVAAAKGVDVMALETTLYDVVDPDALEQLFAPMADGTPRSGGRLVLEIEGCEVVVDSTGDVVATPLPVPDETDRMCE